MSHVGQVIDRYRVEAQLGQGSYGAVYRAQHTVLDTRVALKVLWPDKADDPKNVERFLREARAAASIGSDRIVRVIDAGTTPDATVFLALELLDGEDLSQVLERRGKLGLDETAHLIAQVLEGLAAAHGQGIVHRDLKPANVFVTRHEGIKILDFGISKILGAESLTERGTALGTPRYMAPEQLSGRAVDARADLYAVGVMLYQMLSGAPPYEGTGYELIVRRVKGEPPIPLGQRVRLPSAVEDVVHRALATEPAGRWPTAGSLRRALEAAVSGQRQPAAALTMNPSVSPLSGPLPARSEMPASEPAPKKPPRPSRTVALPEPAPASLPARPAPSHPTVVAPRVGGPVWGWAAILGLALLVSLAAGVFAVLAWQAGSHKRAPQAREPARQGPVTPSPITPISPPMPAPEPRRSPPEPPFEPRPEPQSESPEPQPEPAPRVDPGAVRFELSNVRGSRSTIEQYLDARRPRFAECAVDRPARIPLIFDIGMDATWATEHPRYSSTAPAATHCVAQAFMSGDLPFDEVDGTVFVELPARAP